MEGGHVPGKNFDRIDRIDKIETRKTAWCASLGTGLLITFVFL